MEEQCLIKSESATPRYELLHSLVIDNIEHFRKNGGKFNEKFLEIFSQFLTRLNAIEIEVNSLVKVVHLYDFDADTPGNGYRSLVDVCDTFAELSMRSCREVISRRQSFTFSKCHYYQEVETLVHLLDGLLSLLRIAQTIRSKNEPGALYSDYDDAFIQQIATELGKVDKTCFYGRLMAFQLDESLKKTMRFICLMEASFSHVYYASGGKIPRLGSAMVSYFRYSHSPSKLSKRLCKVIGNASANFCKAFWNLQGLDFMERIFKSVADPLPVKRKLELLPNPLQLIKDDGTLVDIPIPSSHIPASSIACWLLCADVREGQVVLDETEGVRQSTNAVKPASPYLIIFLYGSGYICISSNVQKIFLNEWAIRLDAPIFHILYSLAPEAPYPRPLEDCVYAYAWAIKNCHRLGSTGEKICLVGCSGGGDLAMSLTMRAIQLGIRKPDGFLVVYPSTIVRYLPTPANMLFHMDPLLPLEFGIGCLTAHIGDPQQPEGIFANRSLEGKSLNALVAELNKKAGTNYPFKSFFLVPDNILSQFPPTRVMSSHRDPMMDYAIILSKRLKALGKDVRLDIVGNLVHGFIVFGPVSKPAHEGSLLCIQRIRDLLQMPDVEAQHH